MLGPDSKSGSNSTVRVSYHVPRLHKLCRVRAVNQTTGASYTQSCLVWNVPLGVGVSVTATARKIFMFRRLDLSYPDSMWQHKYSPLTQYGVAGETRGRTNGYNVYVIFCTLIR